MFYDNGYQLFRNLTRGKVARLWAIHTVGKKWRNRSIKKEILVYYIFSGSVLVKKETVQFTVMCSLHLLVFFQNTVLVPMRTGHLSTIVLVICLLPLS